MRLSCNGLLLAALFLASRKSRAGARPLASHMCCAESCDTASMECVTTTTSEKCLGTTHTHLCPRVPCCQDASCYDDGLGSCRNNFFTYGACLLENQRDNATEWHPCGPAEDATVQALAPLQNTFNEDDLCCSHSCDGDGGSPLRDCWYAAKYGCDHESGPDYLCHQSPCCNNKGCEDGQSSSNFCTTWPEEACYSGSPYLGRHNDWFVCNGNQSTPPPTQEETSPPSPSPSEADTMHLSPAPSVTHPFDLFLSDLPKEELDFIFEFQFLLLEDVNSGDPWCCQQSCDEEAKSEGLPRCWPATYYGCDYNLCPLAAACNNAECLINPRNDKLCFVSLASHISLEYLRISKAGFSHACDVIEETTTEPTIAPTALTQRPSPEPTQEETSFDDWSTPKATHHYCTNPCEEIGTLCADGIDDSRPFRCPVFNCCWDSCDGTCMWEVSAGWCLGLAGLVCDGGQVVASPATVLTAQPPSPAPTVGGLDPSLPDPKEGNQTALNGHMAKGHGDPHFVTWSGHKYDFHGSCDMVLLHTPIFAQDKGLTIHIRTVINTWWSYISAVVLKVGEDTLEVMGGPLNGEDPRLWVNGRRPQNLPTTKNGNLEEHIAGFQIHYKQINSKQSKYRISFGKGDALSIQTFNEIVDVTIKAKTAQGFEGSVGLMGSFPSGQMMSRDGSTDMVDDPIAFGKEWQVRGWEPMLFRSTEGAVQHPSQCVMPSFDVQKGRHLRRRLGEVMVTEEDAATACALVDEDTRPACIFDCLAINDLSIAEAYYDIDN